jgi:hypothetical protein
MLMFKERRPAIRTLRGGRSRCCTKPVPSANARSTAGCRTETICTLASAPSSSLVRSAGERASGRGRRRGVGRAGIHREHLCLS